MTWFCHQTRAGLYYPNNYQHYCSIPISNAYQLLKIENRNKNNTGRVILLSNSPRSCHQPVKWNGKLKKNVKTGSLSDNSDPIDVVNKLTG